MFALALSVLSAPHLVDVDLLSVSQRATPVLLLLCWKRQRWWRSCTLFVTASALMGFLSVYTNVNHWLIGCHGNGQQ